MTKPDFEQWVGDDQDGCYVKVFECEDGTWRNEVIVDSETGSFVDTLDECDGFATHEEAMESGRGMAIEWCINNEVDFEDRCEHGMFFSGAGACPQCGGGAE